MKLKIENVSKIAGSYFLGGEFQLNDIEERNDSYKFYFSELPPSRKVITYTLSRFGEWDDDDRKWYYRFGHRASSVSAGYFSDIRNVKKIFNEFLKDSK